MKTVVGMFDDMTAAEQVVRELQNSGFNRDDISLIARDQRRADATKDRATDRGTQAGEGAAAGAGTGAILGGLGGLLVGLGALAIPGIGPIVAAGPIATTLAGAGIGAAAGGIVGALVGAGIPEEEANIYAEGVRRGSTLVTVRSPDDMATQAQDIIRRHNPVDIHTRSEQWRHNNWTRFDEKAQPYSDTDIERERSTYRTGTTTRQTSGTTRDYTSTGTPSGAPMAGAHRSFNDYSRDFQANYNTAYGTRGHDYSYYEPAYRYGYDIAGNERYRGRSWNEIETQVRRDWESSHPNSRWDDFRDAIQHAWDRVTHGGSDDYPSDRSYRSSMD